MNHFTLRALVEDRGQEASLRGLLDRVNRVRELRVESYPRGKGAGEQFVRERFPSFVGELRKQRHQHGLWGVVVIDGDVVGAKKRRATLLQSVIESGKSPVDEDDQLVLLIPTRNIETWAWCLLGNATDEVTDYKGRFPDSLRSVFKKHWTPIQPAEPASLTDARRAWARLP